MPVLESSAIVIILWGVIGYLLGSIPFGIVFARVMGLGNLRDIGSGNIGATNVLRTGNKTAAALTVLFDGGKGVVALLAARAMGGEDTAQIAGLMAMIGHCYPVWLKFAGGKGVATFLGILLALSFPVGVGCCIAWLVAALTSRISSMGALAAAAISPILLIVFGGGYAIIMVGILTGLIYWRHRANITRLRAGTEPKIGQKT